jgi:hypothetical protein
MGGREAIRGFSIQTLVVVLESLEDAASQWIAVTLEPDSSNDKVDILWEFQDRRRAQQVKSSQNQISKASVETWAKALKASQSANEYEVVLAGPVAQAVIDDAPFDGVEVPLPLALDTLALLERAVTKVDRYLTAKNIMPVPLSVREILVSLVAAQLTEGAIKGRRFTREEFDGWLLRWITSAYPQAIANKLSANCEILWSEVVLGALPRAADRAFQLVLPLSFVNGGPGVVVVQWLLLKVFAGDVLMRYEPIAFEEDSDRPISRTSRGFGEFAVLPNSAREICLTFVPTSESGYSVGLWPLGEHKLSLYVKYAGLAEPRLVRDVSVTITEDHRAALSGTPRSIRLYRIEPI